MGAGTISEDDRLKLEGYLAHANGTTDKLPVTHPYKSTAPVFEYAQGTPVISQGAVQGFNITQGAKQVSLTRDWIPSDLTVGSQLWLKGDAGLNYNGSNEITSWEDQSGNGNDAVTTSPDKPYLNTFASQNAIPSVHFRNDYATYLTHPPVLNTTATQEYTAFYQTAFRPATDAALSYIHAGNNLQNTYTLGFWTYYLAGNSTYGIARVQPVNEGYWVKDDPLKPVDNKWTTVSFQNSNIFVDGVEPAVERANTGNAFGGGLTTLGARLDVIGHFLGGAVGEVLVFDYTMTENDRQLVEGYLAHKWGTAAELPVGHPYKNAAPQVVLTSDGGYNVAQGTVQDFNTSIVAPSIPSLPKWYEFTEDTTVPDSEGSSRDVYHLYTGTTYTSQWQKKISSLDRLLAHTTPLTGDFELYMYNLQASGACALTLSTSKNFGWGSTAFRSYSNYVDRNSVRVFSGLVNASLKAFRRVNGVLEAGYWQGSWDDPEFVSLYTDPTPYSGTLYAGATTYTLNQSFAAKIRPL
jgi:hypothetical protein